MILFILSLCFLGVLGTEFTLPGECPRIKSQGNLNFTRFSGLWHLVGGLANNGRAIDDCSILDFQEDNQGYTLRETYVDVNEGNRTQKSYFAKLEPTFDAGNIVEFIIFHKVEDKILRYPFLILSTDYDNYAIIYFCEWLKEKIRKHYVRTWILNRSKNKLEGDILKKVEDALSKYPELAEHRHAFVFKEFTETICAFTNKLETDFLTSNFW